MENPKYKVGDKVVPIAKTAGVINLERCDYWNIAKSTGQNYLFVTVILSDGTHVCNRNANSDTGNWYLESDLIPFDENAQTPVVKEMTVLEEAQSLIYGDREKDYGKTSENFADIAKGWSVLFKTTVTAEQVALAMAWLKICRANKDNCGKRDSYVDCAGYMGCIEKIKKSL